MRILMGKGERKGKKEVEAVSPEGFHFLSGLRRWPTKNEGKGCEIRTWGKQWELEIISVIDKSWLAVWGSVSVMIFSWALQMLETLLFFLASCSWDNSSPESVVESSVSQ